MSAAADNLFRETFASFRGAISGGSTSPGRRKSSQANFNNKDVITELLDRGSVEDMNRKLEILRTQRIAHASKMMKTEEQAKLALQAVNGQSELQMERCKIHTGVVVQNVDAHEQESSGRLKEFVYEVIGEYAKSFVRANRRYALVSIADCKTMSEFVMQLRWKRFVYKFLSNITHKVDERKKGARDSISGELLSPHVDETEINLVAEAMRKRLSNKGFDKNSIASVIRFERIRGKERATASNVNLTPVVAENPADFAHIESELVSWISRASRSAGTTVTATGAPPVVRPRSASNISASSDKPQQGSTSMNRLHEFIQSSRIEWMCPTSYWPNIWDDIVEDTTLEHNTTESIGLQSQSHADRELATDISRRMTFTKTFSAQHTSRLASNRLYICLEERYIWAKGPHALSIDGADEQKYPVLALFSYLQVTK